MEFCGKFEHAAVRLCVINVTSVNRKKESQLVGYMACVDAAGGRSFIAFSHSSWNN